MTRLLAAMVTREGESEPRLVCGGCAELSEDRLEARYYLTSYTIELMAGKVCQSCRRTVGAVALDASADVGQ